MIGDVFHVMTFTVATSTGLDSKHDTWRAAKARRDGLFKVDPEIKSCWIEQRSPGYQAQRYGAVLRRNGK